MAQRLFGYLRVGMADTNDEAKDLPRLRHSRSLLVLARGRSVRTRELWAKNNKESFLVLTLIVAVDDLVFLPQTLVLIGE